MLTGETRLDNLMRELSELVQTVADWNHPETHGGNAGRATGKPGYRTPGRQQCPHLANCVVSILRATVKDVEREMKVSNPRDAGAEDLRHGPRLSPEEYAMRLALLEPGDS